ncbi:unnamed protein product, partial [Laminaria digitata]
WALSFSSSLEQGVTTMKTEEVVSLALASSSYVGFDAGCEAPPEGLEPFFSPSLPADGRGPCACSPLGSSAGGAGRDGGGTSRKSGRG